MPEGAGVYCQHWLWGLGSTVVPLGSTTTPSGMTTYAQAYAVMSVDEYKKWRRDMQRWYQQQQKQGAQVTMCYPYPGQHPRTQPTYQMTEQDYRLQELRMQQEHERAMAQLQINAQQKQEDRQWQMYQDQVRRQEEAARAQARYQQNMALAQMFGTMIPMIVVATQKPY